MSAAVLSTALAFARHGHAVFPVTWPVEHDGRLTCSCGGALRGKPCGSPAKHRYGRLAKHGLRSATVEVEIINEWFGCQAPDANLGVCTDRLVVLDIDPRHGGDDSVAALVREHGEFPPTWRVLTGGGGEHVLFAAPDGVVIGNVTAEQMENPPFGSGIDLRARGGYIVAPPSRHISGRSYAWSVDHHPKDVTLAPVPDWLQAQLTAHGKTQGEGCAGSGSATGTPLASHGPPPPLSSDVWARLTGQPITEYRDFAAAQLAGHMFRHSCAYALVRGMLHAWNRDLCRPPLDAGEIDRILGRIKRLDDKRREQARRTELEAGTTGGLGCGRNGM